MTRPVTDAQRELAEHRGAVRVNASTDANHAASTTRRLLDLCRYSRLPVPDDVRAAADALERYAVDLASRLARERLEREQAGVDLASFQLALERGMQSRDA